MTQRERMVQGLLYDTSDEELVKMRTDARLMTGEYNATLPTEEEKRTEIMENLLGENRGGFYIETPFRCDYGKNISIGKNFYANFNLTVLDCAPVKIGDDVLIGPNVSLLTPVHPLLPCDRNIRFKEDGTPFDYEYAKPITIGSNVWIAGNVVVNGGVTIGSNSVIGSGSVVTRDIPEGVIAVGNPCRVLRKLTEADKQDMSGLEL